MEIKFPKDKKTEDIIKTLEEQLDGRKLGQMVQFSSEDGNLKVLINKLGKSTLEFCRADDDDDACFKLEKEKIAFAHRAFKDDITQKIMQVIEKIGGKVS